MIFEDNLDEMEFCCVGVYKSVCVIEGLPTLCCKHWISTSSLGSGLPHAIMVLQIRVAQDKDNAKTFPAFPKKPQDLTSTNTWKCHIPNKNKTQKYPR